jgi:putative endonuclease
MFYVYIIYSKSFGKKYIGQTGNIETRLNQHNTNYFKSYTNNRGPWQLIYSKEFATRQEALKHEKYLKTGVGRDWKKQNFKI